jgi:CDP-paratose 2-epimerase
MSGRASAGDATLITGGAGFIGANVADRLLSAGESVVILDSLARPGSERNLDWLRRRHSCSRLRVELGDVRNTQALRRSLEGVTAVYHFAAQVAVTTSLEDPLDDFGVNLEGTVRLLEELRRLPEAPFLLFTSTNKVYGALPDVELRDAATRCEPADAALAAHGVGEDRPLDFCSPYGCSKGGADQYVLDYAKSFGIPATVFRMSCIYGRHQHGNEDQGWVAHFIIRALAGEPLTVYGDGTQVRDVLFADDLVEAMLLARSHADRTAGRAFNIGGGPERTLSLLELVQALELRLDCALDLRFDATRVGDQRYYVSDTRRFEQATGWQPEVGVEEGVERLAAWLEDESAPRRALAAGGRR